MRRIDLDGEVIVEQRRGPYDHKFSLLSKMFVEQGTAADWNAMKALHYKADATGVGPLYLRLVIEHTPGNDEVIGVIVLTVPKILDAGRNQEIGRAHV